MFCQPKIEPPRLSLLGQNNNNQLTSSQKKKRKSNTIAGPSSLDEENRLQRSTNLTINTTDCDLSPQKSYQHQINKSPRLEKSVKNNEVEDNIVVDKMKDSTNLAIDTLNDDLKSSNIHSKNPSPNASECASEVSSVSQRREWLKSFEQKQSSNIFRSLTKDERPEMSQSRQVDNRNKKETRDGNTEKDPRQSPPASPAKSNVSFNRKISISHYPTGVTNSATKPKQRRPAINRRASSAVMMRSWKDPRVHEGVKATDEGYASVASLSKWLENDPTSVKKKRHIRRGRNIISKSRQFERGLEDVIVLENKISRGAVGDKKKWLENAFQSVQEEHEDDTSSIYSGYVQSDVGRSFRSHPNFNRQGAQTEIITDDAASSMSVSDKQTWLKNAFSKSSDERKRPAYTRARTDIVHNRGQNRDETASRAKMMFKERSARKLSSAQSRSSLMPTDPKKSVALEAPVSSSEDFPEDEAASQPEEVIVAKSEEEAPIEPKKTVQISESVEEDEAPVDFRAARQALIERSKKNGHNTQVVNKVFLRKKKFEKLEAESRRKSMGVGLMLKSSWDLVDTSSGRPSNVYEKRYVPTQNIAPKKSFEELP